MPQSINKTLQVSKSSDANLVQAVSGEPRASTKKLAVGFGTENRSTVKLIQKYANNFLKFGRIFEQNERRSKLEISSISNATKSVGTRGKELVYFLNEEQATLLGTLTRNNEKTVEFKTTLVGAFFEAKRKLQSLNNHQSSDQWIAARKDGKVERRAETDAIKEFIQYAKDSGSNNADYYYTALTRMENKTLFIQEGNFKNLRDVMSTRQLMTVAIADGIVEKAIREGISKKLHYKDVFQLAKERVINFTKLYGTSKIIDPALECQAANSLEIESVAA